MRARSALLRRASISIAAALVAAGLVGIASPVGAASTSAGTSVTAAVTASGHLSSNWSWALTKAVEPASAAIADGATTTASWTVTATRSAAATTAFVDGQVCVTNTGARATSGLAITVRLSRPSSKAVLASSPVHLGANPVLQPSATSCWYYRVAVPGAPIPGAAYKATAAVTISNKAPGRTGGPSPSATTLLPAVPDTSTNASVTVTDSNGETWVFGGSGSVSYTEELGCPADDGQTVNTASIVDHDVSAQSASPSPASATFTLDCPDPADIAVDKSTTTPAVSAGDAVSFSITVANEGQTAAADVELSDPLPTGVSWSDDAADCSITAGILLCSFGGISAGAGRTVTVSGTTGVSPCGLLTSSATATSTNEPSTVLGNNTDSADISVACPDISVTKLADDAEVAPGSTIGFTITVANNGPGTAYGVTLYDDLPAAPGLSWTVLSQPLCSITAGVLSCSFGTLAQGDDATVHIVSDSDGVTCGTISNSATASAANEADDSLSDNTSTASVTLACPQLVVVKSADADEVAAGGSVGFTITVTNSGPGEAAAVTLTDALPQATGLSWVVDAQPACSIVGSTLSCSFGTLGSGASATVHIVSGTTAATCGTHGSTATASASNHADVSDQGSVTVVCGPHDVSVIKTAQSEQVLAGDAIVWTLTMANDGSDTVDASLIDVLPTGISWTEDSASCAIAAGVLVCSVDVFASGDALTVHVTGATDSSDCGTVVNTATAGAHGTDEDPSNNESNAQVAVICQET